MLVLLNVLDGRNDFTIGIGVLFLYKHSFSMLFLTDFLINSLWYASPWVILLILVVIQVFNIA